MLPWMLIEQDSSTVAPTFHIYTPCRIVKYQENAFQRPTSSLDLTCYKSGDLPGGGGDGNPRERFEYDNTC